MKTTARLIIFLFALLLACAAALAQSAPRASRTSRKTARDYQDYSAMSIDTASTDPSLVMSRPDGLNFYLEGGLACLNTKMTWENGYSERHNFCGPALAFGWRFKNKKGMKKLQFDVSLLTVARKNTYIFEDSSTLTSDATFRAVPVLLTYSYCIPLTANRRWEMRFSPTAGIYTLRIHETRSYWSDSNAWNSSMTSQLGLDGAIGAGIGVTGQINKFFYLDFGYRFLWVSPINFAESYVDVGPLAGYFGSIDGQFTHTLTLSLGWKF